MTEPTTMAGFIIRPIREEELPALEWDGEYAHFRNLFRQSFEEMKLGQRVMLVAHEAESDALAGQVFVQFISGDPKYADGASRGYLYALRVRSGYQNRGLGRQLILAAEDHLRSRAMLIATIGVAKDNLRAQKLYERMGYEIVAEDSGRWTYVDHLGRLREVDEPSWLMAHEL
jgi:ribosomal protein S18 acetylase RimI-like enzyme